MVGCDAFKIKNNYCRVKGVESKERHSRSRSRSGVKQIHPIKPAKKEACKVRWMRSSSLKGCWVNRVLKRGLTLGSLEINLLMRAVD